MSREVYEASVNKVGEVLSDKKYGEVLEFVKKYFEETHISITEIDKDKMLLYGYYFEKLLVTPITFESKDNETILDLIYSYDEIDKETYDFLKNKKLSIFKVKKIKKENFFVIDVFEKKKVYTLKLSDEWPLINKGDLIQGYMYFAYEPYLSPQSLIHPFEVNKYILKNVKLILKGKSNINKDNFLAKLFRKFVNSKRYFKKNALDVYKMDI